MWTISPSRALTLPLVATTSPRRCISRAAATTSARSDTRDRLLVWRLEHARLGEHGIDELGRRHVEGGIESIAASAHLGGVAFLDRDLLAARRARIDRRKGCRDVEGDPVASGKHR